MKQLKGSLLLLHIILHLAFRLIMVLFLLLILGEFTICFAQHLTISLFLYKSELKNVVLLANFSVEAVQ